MHIIDLPSLKIPPFDAGLPHAHILVKLQTPLNAPERINEIVVAAVPEDTDMQQLFLRHHIHGPCEETPNVQCRQTESGRCRFGYPKQFASATTIDEDTGSAEVKRPEDGRSFTLLRNGREITVDNRNASETNLALLRLFDAHINVQARSNPCK